MKGHRIATYLTGNNNSNGFSLASFVIMIIGGLILTQLVYITQQKDLLFALINDSVKSTMK
jgi:hypothetical protein